ncbi:hypothetical protein FS749_002990 [Ceratobasidium sp. UAMH 11750]|nr:hypothetical protein FS749_002990 [Ceratobasidium sp. UAMH 11750]
MWMLYVTHLAYDAILFVITVWRAWVSSRTFGSSPLMQRLVENGALHSGVLVVLMLFACIGGATNTLSIPSNGSGILGAMSSVVCSRIIFSLHTLAEGERRRRLPETTAESIAASVRVVLRTKDLNSTPSSSTANKRSTFLDVTDSKPRQQSYA